MIDTRLRGSDHQPPVGSISLERWCRPWQGGFLIANQTEVLRTTSDLSAGSAVG